MTTDDASITAVLSQFPKRPEPTTGGGDRDQWLAELERDAFPLSDDRLQAHLEDHLPSQQGAGRQSDQQAILNQGAARIQAVAQLRAAMQQIQTVPQPPPHPSADMASVPSQPSSLGVSPGGPSSPTAVTASSAAQLRGTHVPQLDYLINQMRFSELNLSVTHRGDEVTLWIRDFKQKYADELVRWLGDFQQWVMGSGKVLGRIMVNGKQIQHINELRGGGSWQ